MITEAMCIVKAIEIDLFTDWLKYHARILNRIHIWDNESYFNLIPIVEEVKKETGCSIVVERVSGRPRQYALYNNYANIHSTADWVMALDDDEYIIMNDNLKSVEDIIKYYKQKFPDMEMLCLKWHHKFPEVFHSERNGAKVIDYCKNENITLASLFPCGDRGVKTIVHRSGSIHYEETIENPNGGHIPKHSKANFGFLCNGEQVRQNLIKSKLDAITDEVAYLAHYRYTGYSEYTRKMRDRQFSISNIVPLKRKIRFNDILELLK